jgi:hypothetical protein
MHRNHDKGLEHRRAAKWIIDRPHAGRSQDRTGDFFWGRTLHAAPHIGDQVT